MAVTISWPRGRIWPWGWPILMPSVQSPRHDLTSGVLGASLVPRNVPSTCLVLRSEQSDGQAMSALAKETQYVHSQGWWHRMGRYVLEPGHSVGQHWMTP